VRTILLAGAISLIVALLGTPVAIRVFTKRGYGQEIRSDGAPHAKKRGTPTMGGTVILIASLAGYFIAHPVTGVRDSVSGLLVMFLMTGLGIVGFLDDFIKLYMQRSLGLRSGAKLVGQAVVGGIFAILALHFPDGYDLTPASTQLSFIYDFGISIGSVLFVVWVVLMVTGTSNAVNLTDGLDGLATGASILALGAYVIIGIWQLRNDCTVFLANNCYEVRDPLDVAVVAASVMGACFGFLWWNAPPAKIFMGDTGSLALGGVLAGLAIISRTELLLVLLGGLFIIITLSVVIQVGSFKLTGKRVFRMAPLQHHFELAGWAETTIVVRFWLVAGMFVALGLAIFYVGLPPARLAELLVDRGTGQPVRERGHRVGADAEHDLQRVARGEPGVEEGLDRLVPGVTGGVQQRADGLQPRVRHRVPGAQRRDDRVRRVKRPQPRRVYRHAQLAAVAHRDRHDYHLDRQRVERTRLEHRVELGEPLEQLRRLRPAGHGGREVAKMVSYRSHCATRCNRSRLESVLGEDRHDFPWI
jgi:phospho-N-acetylmuramoyl-pentapeptide-transferase